jgi:predicted nucleotidyltransferase
MTHDQKNISGLTPAELALVKNIIGDGFEAWVFGSRATGKHRAFSDLDICLKAPDRIADEAIASLRFAFQESNLPYLVDIVDWSSIADDFKRKIERDAISI